MQRIVTLSERKAAEPARRAAAVAARVPELAECAQALAVHAYDTSGYARAADGAADRATDAVGGAAALASILPAEIARFHQVIDP